MGAYVLPEGGDLRRASAANKGEDEIAAGGHIWGAGPPHRWERSSPKVRPRSQWRPSIVFPQMTKGLVRAVGVGGHDVADLHVVAGHDDAVDQDLHQRSPLRERRVIQPHADVGAEGLDRGGQDTSPRSPGSPDDLIPLANSQGAKTDELAPINRLPSSSLIALTGVLARISGGLPEFASSIRLGETAWERMWEVDRQNAKCHAR